MLDLPQGSSREIRYLLTGFRRRQRMTRSCTCRCPFLRERKRWWSRSSLMSLSNPKSWRRRTRGMILPMFDSLHGSSETRNCPRCKVPRRASKTLTIARLPPVLLIQLKRFSTQNGVFWDKSETPVIFPVNGLDLTRYMPRRQPTGKEDPDDPRTQLGPFKYDLYGVSNHMGTLSSGHCECLSGDVRRR